MRRVELARFGRAETEQLVRGLLPAPPPPELVDRVFRRSGGNPFFIEELVRVPAAGRIPESLRDLLLDRIDRLPDPARGVLDVAAVAGPAVPHALLAEVSRLPEPALVGALRAAVDARVLAADGDSYRFRHGLLQEAVVEDLLPPERVRLHRACAEALTAHPGLVPPERFATELAFHWYGAGERRRALPALVDAAAVAERMYAHAEQSQLLVRALVATALGQLGAYDDAFPMLSAARELAERRGDGIRLARVLNNLAHLMVMAGRLPEAIESARTGLAVSSPKHRALLAMLVLDAGRTVPTSRLARGVWGADQPENPRRAVQVLVTRLRSLLAPAEIISTRAGGYALEVDPEQVDVGRFGIWLREASRAADGGDVDSEAGALAEALSQWRGEPLADVPSEALRDAVAVLCEQRLQALERRFEADLRRGRHLEVVAELSGVAAEHPLRERIWVRLIAALSAAGRRADVLNRAAGDRVGQAHALNGTGWYRAQLGDHARALADCQQALALFQGIGDERGQAGAWDSIGFIRHGRGDYPDALRCYQEALRLYRSLGERFYAADTLVHIGDTHRATGDRAAARAAWQQALDILEALDDGYAERVRAKLDQLGLAETLDCVLPPS